MLVSSDHPRDRASFELTAASPELQRIVDHGGTARTICSALSWALS